MMQEHMLDTLNGNLTPHQTPNNVSTPNNTPWGPPPPLEPPPPPLTPGMTPVNGHDFGVSPAGLQMISSSTPTPGDVTPNSNTSAAAAAAAKKSSSRRNAWGNLSYADLITQAIQSTPEKRLTLSQVYEWMVANIPYFKDKGDSNSSAGWKVRPLFLIIN